MLFVEVKTRWDQMVEKTRFPVERRSIESLLENGPEPVDDPSIRAAHQAFEASRKGVALRPLFVAHYRRYTLQDRASRLRITLDDLVSYHMPPARHSSDVTCLARAYLPPPMCTESMWIMEVKSLGASPLWIDEMLGKEQPVAYSKFGIGVKELERRGVLFCMGN
jgi:hypothetical protein